MEDPRIEELMECLDSVDEDGKLTSIALIARRVESYMEVVDELRETLDEQHASVRGLEERASNLKQSIEERDSVRTDITELAQTAAMKATFAINTASGSQLRKDADEQRKKLKQFERDYEEDQRRLKEAMRALEGQQARLMDTRDQIARRMNIIDALLQRAEIEWPSYFFEENERIKSTRRGGQDSDAPARRRGRGRRRVIRRRKAS